MALTIRDAVAIREVAAVARLWREYWQEFGFTPCFQGFEEEVSGLPGKYKLLLAWWDGEPAGTIAYYRLDEERAEAKRLYVRQRFRGKGIARKLMEALFDRLKAEGYRKVVGDSMPEAMQAAMALYRELGFQETAPYLETPTPGAVAIEREL
jgi:GNAT superfamily N-acetyltransferase